MAWATTLTGSIKNVTIDGGGEDAFTAGASATSEGLKLTGHTQHTFSGDDQHHVNLEFVGVGGATELNPWIGLTGDNLIIDSVRATGSLTEIVDFVRLTGARSRLSDWWVETNRHGLVMSGAIRNIITDWYLSVGSQADDTWDGINLTTSDFNLIDSIEVVGDGGASDPRCGVNITDAASNDNYVGVVHAPDAQTAPICDSGTDTILLALQPYVNAFFDFYNGTFAEAFDALVTSAAGIVTLSLTNAVAGDLTMRFSDGQTILDVTPADTIVLTAGSDAAPQGNWVYIPQATKVLTLSTTAWPSTEHIKIGYFLVPSAAFVASDGVYVNQNWNDAAQGSTGQGHLTHMTRRIRLDGAYYFSGLAGAGVDDYLTLAGVTADLKIGAGVVFQMHQHNVPAFDTSAGDKALVVNWSGDPFHDVTNLFDITADSTGAAIGNNRFFNLVIWTVGNKSGEYEPAMINLPSGVYVTLDAAENDVDGHDNFTIPRAFNLDSSTGVLICRLTIQMKTAGPWVYQSTVDLRGTTPQTASGGGAGTVTEFADNQFTIFDETDTTKVFDFEASGITTGTTRTLTVQDASGTIDYTEEYIAEKAATALPSTYPERRSMMLIAADATWPGGATDGIVETWVTGAGAAGYRMRQQYTVQDGYVVFQRFAATNDSWASWQLVTPFVASTSTNVQYDIVVNNTDEVALTMTVSALPTVRFDAKVSARIHCWTSNPTAIRQDRLLVEISLDGGATWSTSLKVQNDVNTIGEDSGMSSFHDIGGAVTGTIQVRLIARSTHADTFFDDMSIEATVQGNH